MFERHSVYAFGCSYLSRILYLPVLRVAAMFCACVFRVRELLCTEMVVEKFLPFSFFSSGKSWRRTIGYEASGDTPYPKLPSKRVKHLLVEMYVATKKVSDVVHHALGSLLSYSFFFLGC